MKLVPLFSCILIILVIGCKKTPEPTIPSAISFHNVSADSSGIDFANILSEKDDLNIIEYLYYYNGGGVAIGDINNDGLEDIYFTANQTPDRLYLNLGNLKFRDITESANLQIDSTWSTGVTMEDVNNDGYLDIYVSKVGKYKSLNSHNLLYLNNGDETFTEASKKTGLDFSGLSTQATFFDYDKDGDVDMYLMNHSVHSTRSYGNAIRRNEKDSIAGDRLYENKLESGTLSFEDVTQKAGIYSSPLGYGLALVASDINQDGWTDIYVGNDFHENDYLYLNQGDKTFKEVSADYFNHMSRFTMGVDIADMNNDGRSDIFTLDMMPFDAETFLKSGGEDSDKVSLIKDNFGFERQYSRNNFQLNRENSSFSDVALMTETHATDWSWSVLMEDFDNDGLKDIYITNGIFKRPNDLDYINFLSTTDFSSYDKSKSEEIERRLIASMPSLKIANRLFRNKGDLSFEDLSDKSGLEPSYSNGSATADLDNDGDMDLVINNIDEKATLLENKSNQEGLNNWIGLNLKGTSAFPITTGSKVMIYCNGKEFYKELITTRGFESASTRKLHFGIGNLARIDSAKIVWPDGKIQSINKLAVNQYNSINRDSTKTFQSGTIRPSKFTLTGFPYIHIENTYLDYEREPLMPEKLSIEGPAVVNADFNSDGLQDIFIGGPGLEAPVLFMQQKDGTFTVKNEKAFDNDSNYEDVDAAAFDLENDGDLDIYVTRGGNDQIEGDHYLEDRIYINDSKGNFKPFISVLPKFNGGSVAAADFDGDGFDDLFLGSRSIPGAYGLSPYSLILRNTGKSSFEVVQIARFGMITDSKWTDINNDGKLDLIMAGDWMPITILINNGNSKFSNQTKEFGLANTSGMWNTLWISDLDGNGYDDIIAGNAGLNMKWKASPEHPVKLYLADFDKNQQLDPLIFYDFHGQQVPFASKDNLMRQLPMLQKKFLSYSDFSKIKSLEDLTGKKPDSVLETKQVDELRSMIFLNSEKEFTANPLPKEAQMSSIEAFYLDKDHGNPVLYFGGNYMGYVTELGNSDANPGGVLSNFNNGNFKSYENLPLPKNLSIRKIVKIGEGHYLFISNNDKAYTVQVYKQ
ncbi:MAG: VCBS repeat-containing protein [Maribacter sp.]|nr:VCBS repeat-containing protein [Maribacter sp.]